MRDRMKVSVIGASVSGLSTAQELPGALPRFNLRWNAYASRKSRDFDFKLG